MAERSLTPVEEGWIVIAAHVDPDRLEEAREEGSAAGSPSADALPEPDVQPLVLERNEDGTLTGHAIEWIGRSVPRDAGETPFAYSFRLLSRPELDTRDVAMATSVLTGIPLVHPNESSETSGQEPEDADDQAPAVEPGASILSAGPEADDGRDAGPPTIEARAAEIVELGHGVEAGDRLVAHLGEIPEDQAGHLLAHLGAHLAGFGIDRYRSLLALAGAMKTPTAKIGAMSGLVKALPAFAGSETAAAVAGLEGRLVAMIDDMPMPPLKLGAIAALVPELEEQGQPSPGMVRLLLSAVRGMAVGPMAAIAPVFQRQAMNSLSRSLKNLDPATLAEFSDLIEKWLPGV